MLPAGRKSQFFMSMTDPGLQTVLMPEPGDILRYSEIFRPGYRKRVDIL